MDHAALTAFVRLALARNESSPRIADAAVQAGACGRCALRVAGVWREALFALAPRPRQTVVSFTLDFIAFLNSRNC